jgi:hypothetical protein
MSYWEVIESRDTSEDPLVPAADRWRTLHKFAPALIAALQFRTARANDPVLAALKLLHDLSQSGKREIPRMLRCRSAAINDGAKSAQLGALAFTAIGLFLLATAFSASVEDLLLNRALTISQLGGTAVPVIFAFGLAPAVFVAAHFYTLIRYDMLAENVRQFREDLAATNMPEADRRRCRQLLANVEFVNAQAMPHRAGCLPGQYGCCWRCFQ